MSTLPYVYVYSFSHVLSLSLSLCAYTHKMYTYKNVISGTSHKCFYVRVYEDDLRRAEHNMVELSKHVNSHIGLNVFMMDPEGPRYIYTLRVTPRIISSYSPHSYMYVKGMEEEEDKKVHKFTCLFGMGKRTYMREDVHNHMTCTVGYIELNKDRDRELLNTRMAKKMDDRVGRTRCVCKYTHTHSGT